MRKYFLVLSVIFSFYQCEKQTNEPNSKNIETGEISFAINLSGAPSDISSISGHLSRVYIDSIFFDSQITGDTAETNVEGIIPGRWKLTANAINSNGVIIYSGSTDVDVAAGTQTPVLLRLNPTTGLLEIMVIPEEPVIQDSSLIAYYPFNGNACDESGYGNHGFVYGATLTHDRFGNPNNAYKLDGLDDYINIGNNTVLKSPLPKSIVFWLKSNTPGRNHILTTNFNATRYLGFFFLIYNDGRLRIAFGDGGAIGANSSRSKYGTSILQANTWYQIVGIFRDLADFDIYINGTNDGGTYAGYGAYPAHDTGNFNVGRHDTARSQPPQYFNGILDEIRIYNRVLTEQEIQALYKAVP